MNRFTYTHSLGLDESRRRLFEEATRQGVDISVDPSDSSCGTVVAKSPVGKVSARFKLGEMGIEIEVTKKPTFVPESLVRSAVEDGLKKLLG